MDLARRVLILLVVSPASCSDVGGPSPGRIEGLARPFAGYSDAVSAGGLAWVVIPAQEQTPRFTLGTGALPAPRWSDQTRGLYLVPIPEDVPSGPSVLSAHIGATTYTGAVRVGAPWFVDVAEPVGLTVQHDVSTAPRNCAESHTGLGFADIDSDGDLDAFVGNYSASSTFYRNESGSFVNDTSAVGLDGVDRVSSVSFADIDNDGDPDLFVGRRGANLLFVNEGGTFVDHTSASGITALPQRTMGAAWGDWDGDGDLDLYEVNHVFCFPGEGGPPFDDRLFRNDGLRFTQVTGRLDDGDREVSRRAGFAGLFLDHDDDGDLDLYVAQDDLFPLQPGLNVLWRNDAGRFTGISEATGWGFVHPQQTHGPNSMGIDVGDVNLDGRPDFLISNIGPNVLMQAAGDGPERTYVDVAAELGIQRTQTPWFDVSVTWGPALLDVDNDADLDVFLVGGSLKGGDPIPHALFVNEGGGRFVDRTWEAGLATVGHGKALAVIDIDQDGFLDLAVANWGGGLEVFENQLGTTLANHWLTVELVGNGRTVPRDAFGAQVAATTPDGRTQTCFRTPRPSLSATGSFDCHFGLGPYKEVELSVRWPDGGTESRSLGKVDQHIVIGDGR